MQALGLIEVVGYPPAVEAADAALKAANVTLLSIAKADAGIMTVEIVGDVGAVTAAVDAGARSAARIGLVRARHVISRVESDLLGKVIPSERVYQEAVLQPQVAVIEEEKVDDKSQVAVIEEENVDKKPQVENGLQAEDKPRADDESKSNIYDESKSNVDMHEPVTGEILVEEKSNASERIEREKEKSQRIDFSQEQLSKRSNANLKSLIGSLGIQVTTERLNSMKKQDLIRILLEYSKEHGI